MIDIFNEVYTLLYNDLASYDSSIDVSGVYKNVPPIYPCVSLEEIENSVYQNGMDDMEIENFANVEYEVNIYTQGATNKKSKADGIAERVDALMSSIGLVRQTRNILQDASETTYRIVIRYAGVVSKDHTIYRR